jgi:polyphosphate kinase
MPRNLIERCEVVFPVTQAELHKRLREEILAAYLADNTKARLLLPDGEYIRAPKTGAPFSAQDYLMRIAEGSIEGPPAAADHHKTAAH